MADNSAWKLPPRYHAWNTAGTGSWGQVRYAYDHERSKSVAIKRLDRAMTCESDARCILRETSLLSALRHENIVRLYDIVYAPADLNTFSEIYLVMEACDTDLAYVLYEKIDNTVLKPAQVKKIFYTMLLGLKYIHSAGVYHRDLKPANVLMNEDCTAKIADFGLARAVGDRDDSSEARAVGKQEKDSTTVKKRHLTGHVVSRWYRAPELILLQKNYTEAIDIWSAGCILAELLGMLEDAALRRRGALFFGASCYPLSPKESNLGDLCSISASWFGLQKPEEPSRPDQLNAIFNVIGTPHKDIDWLDTYGQQCVLKLPFRPGTGLENRLQCPPLGRDLMGLVESMLKFNPKERPSVAEVLCDEVWQKVGLPQAFKDQNSDSQELVVLDFENDPLLRAYYQGEISLCQFYTRGGMKTLRSYYQKEIQKYTSDER